MDEIAEAPSGRGWRMLRHIPGKLRIGGGIVLLLIVLAILAPIVTMHSPTQINVVERLSPPNAVFWFGTDEYGRDVFARVLHGGRLSLAMGFAATLITFLFGVPLGLIAGYVGGRLDGLLMRAMDVLMSFPPIMLGLLILAVTDPSLWKSILAVGIVYVPVVVRLVRSRTMELVHEEYILAARARGEGLAYILAREILPNAWPMIIVEASLRVTFAILLAAALSFLGMGAQPPSSDWGLMISEARPFVNQAPWIALAPGFVMCIAVVGINLFGDGLREMLDPRLKSKGGA
ncbi:ABC transporter permease [Roseovarius sp. MBR-6]|jgi:peptide/nickel transport system permease protein|uniref:ABC transporter permease n=1 Tax=Roseovarius sp. MBR-6 TaxID=3156459 RepID=UPI0033999286